MPRATDVEEIRRAAERAGSVTRQLLAFSRKQLLEPRVFDLNETIAVDRAPAVAAARRRRRRPDAAVGRGAAGARRSRTGRAGGDQPGGQRARRDARRRHAGARHGAGNGRRGVRAQPPADAAGRVRRAARVRLGPRHVARDAGPHLRAVLHDQGRRQGHRARAVDGVRHAETDRRLHLRRQRDRPRHDVPALFSAGGGCRPPPRRRRAARRQTRATATRRC